MKKIFILLIALSFINFLMAKTQTEVLLQLHSSYTPQQLEQKMPALRFEKTLIARLNLHLFEIIDSKSFSQTALERHPMIKAIEWNKIIESRDRQPDDARYGEQWALQRLQMPKVWDISTGGFTANGDEIVVAIIDTDFSVEHEDLVENIWVNGAETPNNGIDDDQNGFVDDINGWNFGANNNEFQAGVHGTSVAGIIGAKGNNKDGVSGINWDISMMYLKYERSVSEIFAAYEYVTKMRRKYNETKGAAGAFVVAVNSSFGLKNPEICPEDNIWNQAHEMMYEVGILVAAAAKNDPINSDDVGDIPSACPSSNIISVVSTDDSDIFWDGSARGATTLDLGAPGIEVLTTQGNIGYRTFDANSSATPHVTGTIAMLYSLPSTDLAELAINQPKEAATLVRKAILEGTEPLLSLDGIVATGGRLNVFRAVQQLSNLLEPTLNPSSDFTIEVLTPNPINANEILTISYQSPDETMFDLRIYDALGRLVEERLVNPCCFKETEEQVILSNFASGIYFVEIERLGESSVQSFVVNN
ncbi:MAG: S8/S53 family peptidase [Bacteroidota bacterium]